MVTVRSRGGTRAPGGSHAATPLPAKPRARPEAEHSAGSTVRQRPHHAGLAGTRCPVSCHSAVQHGSGLTEVPAPRSGRASRSAPGVSTRDRRDGAGRCSSTLRVCAQGAKPSVAPPGRALSAARKLYQPCSPPHVHPPSLLLGQPNGETQNTGTTRSSSTQ